jgi:D-xylose transport system substrate-binding protein
MMGLRKVLALAVTAGAMTALVACGGDDGGGTTAATASGTGASAGAAKKIALLLPESKTTRYESQDRPNFEAKVKELCSSCEIIYGNAQQDPAKQQQQAEAAITNGADVIVLDSVDAASARTIVTKAGQSDIPVIAYDRLIPDAKLDAYVSFDNVKVGQVQAQSLLDAIGGGQGKSIIMVNGAPTDHSATEYKQGAHEVLDASGVKIAKEYDTPDWSPDKAQREMEQAITAVGKDGFAGVYSANDGMATGIIAAMEGVDIDPSTKPLTGQDAEVTAVQRILSGDQLMTIYLRIKEQADAAAQLAVAAARGEQPPAGLINAKVDNGAGPVPSVLLAPVPVTKDEVAKTIVADGFLKPAQICTKAYARYCDEAGIG